MMWEALLLFSITGIFMLGVMAFLLNLIFDITGALRRRRRRRECRHGSCS